SSDSHSSPARSVRRAAGGCMEIFTIGFTKATASAFFANLRQAGVRRLVDVRLHNNSQLAGFAKKSDLEFFLRELLDADYCHDPMLAPTEELLSAYRKRRITWDEYEERFRDLMAERKIESHLSPGAFQLPTVLLCSEAT